MIYFNQLEKPKILYSVVHERGQSINLTVFSCNGSWFQGNEHLKDLSPHTQMHVDLHNTSRNTYKQEEKYWWIAQEIFRKRNRNTVSVEPLSQVDVWQKVLQPCPSLEKKRRRRRPAKKRMKSVNLLWAPERRRRRLMMRRSILRAQSSIWLDRLPQTSSFTVPSCMQGLETISIFYNRWTSSICLCL